MWTTGSTSGCGPGRGHVGGGAAGPGPVNLSYTKVTSPFDGRIGRRLKDPGNLVGAGEATLLADVDQTTLCMSTSHG